MERLYPFRTMITPNAFRQRWHYSSLVRAAPEAVRDLSISEVSKRFLIGGLPAYFQHNYHMIGVEQGLPTDPSIDN
jgi:hypothetical protein